MAFRMRSQVRNQPGDPSGLRENSLPERAGNFLRETGSKQGKRVGPSRELVPRATPRLEMIRKFGFVLQKPQPAIGPLAGARAAGDS
jgi:hypothetical protein